MQTSKGLIALVAFGAGLATTAGAEEWTKVRIGTEGAYPPWNHTDTSGELIGFEVDLANDLCARMKVECELVAQDWEGIIPALKAGKYDAIMAGMSITDERKEVIQFSISYADEPARFAVIEGTDLAGFTSDISLVNLAEVDPAEEAALGAIQEAFAGKTIGVQVATTHQNFLEAYLGEFAEIRKYDTQENLDLDLQAGRVDAALASMSYWNPLFETDKGAGMTLVGPGLNGGPFGLGVGAGLRQDDSDLAEMFNQAIDAAKADGTIKRLAEEWFGFDVTS